MAYLSCDKFRLTRSIIQGISLVTLEDTNICQICYDCKEPITDKVAIQMGFKLIFQIETRTFHIQCVSPRDFKMLVPVTIPQDIKDPHIAK